VPNVNVSCGEVQSAARQLRAGEQLMEAELQKLKRMVDSVIAETMELSQREEIRWRWRIPSGNS
jgi:hypothetical protein